MNDLIKLKQNLESFDGYIAPRHALLGLMQQMVLIERYASRLNSRSGEDLRQRVVKAYRRLRDDYSASELLDDDELTERYPLLLSYQLCRQILKSFMNEFLYNVLQD